ncbi:flagellar basal body protein [Sphingomonas sp. KRR8]|uniref:FlgK family flagellar hook-associated protein n=1 Tax=Sphingomonas sp. KRR8 TaxID=2942996 RepID=UPI002021B062|nr:flagellar basal body rod C-terminal domain-containing protein [Sphingomonas sp. KRR8]URD61387.1 flagellar basal body protein [Sphingomonas sp. KRR8]
MSLSDILGSALSGLNAAQAGMRSTSNNIANVSTPGYAREEISLSTGVTGGRVTGVRVGEPDRVANRFLEANVYRRSGDWGQAAVTSDYLGRLQSMLGAPGSASSVSARLDALQGAATTMTGSGASEQSIRTFTAQVQDSVQALQQVESDATTLRMDAESEVGNTVESINDLLGRISTLNDTVSRQLAQGSNAGGAKDLRMSAIEQLSSLIKVTTREQPDGRISLDTASGTVLVDRKPRMLSYAAGSGDGVDQPSYPSIDVRFVNPDGSPGAATGERIDTAGVGGKLGGLLELRDRTLPEFASQVGQLFGGLAEALNAASNASTTVPPPAALAGGQTGLYAGDRLGFSGKAVFAVTSASGALVARATVDFGALGAGGTVADAVAAINAGLGGSATATFSNGRLTLNASGTGNGVVVAQDSTDPSLRAGVGFSQFFGLNDLVVDPSRTLTPSGLTTADPHGFSTGQTMQLVIRDPRGRTLAQETLAPVSGGTMGDLVSSLNAGPAAAYGSFALDPRGRVAFTPDPSIPTATVSVITDSTDRLGTGRSFSSLVGLDDSRSTLRAAAVRSDILASAQRLPLARFDQTAAIGQRALGPGDTRGATDLVDQLAASRDLGPAGTLSVNRMTTLVFGRAAQQSSQADSALGDSEARKTDAVNRRDEYSGVNIDEELSRLVVLQNSYSASARVMTTATQMYDTLLGMVK